MTVKDKAARGAKQGTLKTGDAADEAAQARKIPSTVWQIGVMMFLMNTSYVMVYSFSGLYLKHILGASIVVIGVLEGLCEIVSHAMKPISGMISDYLRRRRSIMIIGYICSVISKPLLALSSTKTSVITSRMLERLGNGIQAAPSPPESGNTNFKKRSRSLQGNSHTPFPERRGGAYRRWINAHGYRVV